MNSTKKPNCAQRPHPLNTTGANTAADSTSTTSAASRAGRLPGPIKKNPLDPDIQDLNPRLIYLARTNGFIKQPMELYLSGELTWTEALETMVISLTREFRAQQEIVGGLMKEEGVFALPQKPMAVEYEQNYDNT